MADTGASVSTGRTWCSVPEKLKLHAAMLGLQLGYAGFHVVCRVAINMGISKLVFALYRNILALLLLLPFSYFLERKDRPPLTLSFLFQFFMLALFGITGCQLFYLAGLDNTSPTFAAAIQNTAPAITFLMAALFRIEKVRLDRKDGIAKVLGTVCCVAGATAITLYKGPVIYSPPKSLQEPTPSPMLPSLGDAEGKNWTLGCVYMIVNCLCWSAWIVMQAPVLKKYPARLSVTTYTCFFALVQFLIIAALFERDHRSWIINSNGEVFPILYGGVVASGISFSVQIWCVERGGPVFVAVYQPVETLIVAIMSSIALGEEFYLGGIIGAVIIITGLYLVLWGKNEETKFATVKELPIESTLEDGEDADENNILETNGKNSLSQPLLHPSTGRLTSIM